MLPGPFYLNNVLIALDLVQSLLSVHRFTTDNFCSMEFDLFGPTLPRMLSRTPWLPLLPPPPGIVAWATLAPMS
jgi:hypothetical protein